MADESQIGFKLFNESMRGQKNLDSVYTELEKTVERLNRETSKLVIRHYDSVLSRIELDGSVVRNSLNNLSLIGQMSNGLDPIQNMYRSAFGSLMRDYRGEVLAVAAENDVRHQKVVAKIGFDHKLGEMTEEQFQLLSLVLESSFRKINDMLSKWKNIVYDSFLDGVSKGLDLVSFRSSFFNSDGSVRVGSSLNDVSKAHALSAAVRANTIANIAKADANGYDYCWNSNPMDEKTKPICLEASLAGVIPRETMESEYGWPPRYICRCDIVFTRGEWTGVNQGINEAMEQKRVELINTLKVAPKQKASWKWMGQKILSTDAKRLAGKKMYKEVEELIDWLYGTAVPDFELD